MTEDALQPTTRGIEFWKNWSSCESAKGKHRPVLDQTLASAGSTGIVVSATSKAINQAVLLLGKYHFSGSTTVGSISAVDAATMQSLATTLNHYNNQSIVLNRYRHYQSTLTSTRIGRRR